MFFLKAMWLVRLLPMLTIAFPSTMMFTLFTFFTLSMLGRS
jgi:hypothetical protein